MKKIMTWMEYECSLINARYGEELLFIPFCERDFLKRITDDNHAIGNDGIYSFQPSAVSRRRNRGVRLFEKAVQEVTADLFAHYNLSRTRMQ